MDQPRPGPLSSKVVHLASEGQWSRVCSLLEELGYGPREPFFLARLKVAIGRSRIRTTDEAEAAIAILESILAGREGEAAMEPKSGGQGRAA